MTERRFFIDHPPEDIPGLVEISGGEAHHARHVLRLRKGDDVVLLDDDGQEYPGRIVSCGKEGVVAEALEARPSPGEPTLKLAIGLGLLKSDRMEWVVQKISELGVTALAPLSTERSMVRLDGKRAEAKVARWREIARQAVKQCRRGKPPEIMPIMDMAEFVAQTGNFDSKVILYEESRSNPDSSWFSLVRTEKPPRSVAVLIGPEGGFSAEEVKKARDSGFIPLGFGPRIMRSETAVVAFAAVVGFELGDLSDFS